MEANPAAKQVFVCGATNIDLKMNPPKLPELGQLVVAPTFTIDAGGKANGQACALAKLDIPTYFISCIGKKGTENLIDVEKVSQWQKLGLKTEFVREEEGQTGVCLIMVVGGSNVICEYMGNNSKIKTEDIDKAFKKAHQGDFFLTTYEPNADVVEYALEQAKKKKMQIILTPVPIPTPATINRLDLVDYLIVYESELRKYTGVDIEGGENNRKIRDAYQKLNDMINPEKKRPRNLTLIVCLGLNKGSLFVEGDGIVNFAAPKIEIVDSTLSRATFIGAFISRISRGRGIHHALKYANTAMALCAMKMGGISSLPEDSDVKKLMKDLKMN